MPLTRRFAAPSPAGRGLGIAESPLPLGEGGPERSEGPGEGGFTIAELITVVAIVGVLASVAMPIATFGIRRQKEIELRERIRKITNAIDQYHELRITPNATAAIKKPPDLGQGEWPKTLDELTKPIELNNGKTVRFLRDRDLIDPMTGKNEWTTLSSDDEPDTNQTNGNNVWEIHSKSTAMSLDGKTHYNQW